MAASRRHDDGTDAPGAALPPPAAAVHALDRARIERALPGRSRYQYVRPRVEAVPAEDGGGWKVVSPNCSRNIARDGGVIDIAWLEPARRREPDLLPPTPQACGRPAPLWHLHARDHAAQAWRCVQRDLTLADALTRLCSDPLREFWQ